MFIILYQSGVVLLAACYLKSIVSVQKRIVRYVCGVPALIPTLFVKTGISKLKNAFNLEVCKSMLGAMLGFEVDQSCFTPISMIHIHNTIH